MHTYVIYVNVRQWRKWYGTGIYGNCKCPSNRMTSLIYFTFTLFVSSFDLGTYIYMQECNTHKYSVSCFFIRGTQKVLIVALATVRVSLV